MSITKFLNAGYTQEEAEKAYNNCLQILKMTEHETLSEIIEMCIEARNQVVAESATEVMNLIIIQADLHRVMRNKE